MTNRQAIIYLRIAHGFFNITIFLFIVFQAWFGLRIRKQRKAKQPPLIPAIKRHRKLGPFLIPVGVFGFLSGCIIVYLDYGYLLKYPLHFFAGLTIASLLLVTYPVSRAIRAGESPWRERHYRLGLFAICLYSIQVLLGLGILF
jgi:uncharacterized membrane protein YozB (DUF420 family)